MTLLEVKIEYSIDAFTLINLIPIVGKINDFFS